jgi:hypothetical protein
MQQERSEIEPIAMAEEAVMMVLLDDRRDPWTHAELQRMIGSRVCSENDVSDAIGHLHGSGLVNVTGELVTASRAARRMDELDLRRRRDATEEVTVQLSCPRRCG